MGYNVSLFVSKKGSEIPEEVRKTLAEAGIVLVWHTSPRPKYSPEMPLHCLMYIEPERRKELKALRLTSLSAMQKTGFAPVWRILRSNGFDRLCQAMTAAGLRFTDLDPAALDCTMQEDWNAHGLNNRLANLLLRDDVMAIDMLLGLTPADFRSIRRAGEQAEGILVALQERLRAERTGTAET